MKRNMNGRKRPLFDEELTAQMRTAAPGAGGQNARAGSAPRRKASGNHSADRDAGGRISVISAILTGRRSRSVACVVVAAVIALSAVVSVAASIVASHISSDTEQVRVLNAAEDGERSTLSGGQAAAPAENAAKEKAGTSPEASGNSRDSAVSGAEPDDTAITPDAAQGADAPETDTATDDTLPADTAGEAGAQTGDGAATKHTVRINFWDKDSLVVETDAATLGDAIALSGVSLSEAQLANLDLTAPIESDITVNADVVTYGTEDVEETIPFETEYRQSAGLAAGVTEVTQQGIEGNQTRQFTVTYVNGVEVSRVQTASWVDSYVQNQIITTGTGQSVSADTAAPQSPPPSAASPDSAGGGTIVGADGVTYSYSSVMDVQATFYYAGGTTAYGIPADENVIGVDPSVIPFGTRVYVVGPYGDFGVRIAADCGNMYGNRIDICLNRDNPLAAGFGWQDMKVYILN